MDPIIFISQNWGELTLGVLALIKLVVNLTPSTHDNVVFGYIDTLLNLIIADRKKTPNND